MDKKVLSEIALYYGDVSMPKGFEIDRDKLSTDILESTFIYPEFPFSKNWDMLNTYIREHFYLKYRISLVNKKTWGTIYDKNKTSGPLLDVDPVDLKNSPDYVLLYGVKTNKCLIKIFYEDNRRKGRSWDIELLDNMFIMFPSTNMYTITNTQKDSLNYIQTITYEFM